MANINIIIPDELHRELKLQAIGESTPLKNHIIGQLQQYLLEVRR